MSPGTDPRACLLRVEGLHVARGGREVLRGIDLEVRRGEVVAVMGLSGGGKTSLLRALVGLEEVRAGRAAFDGFVLAPGAGSPAARRELPGHVGIVFQAHHLFEHLSALDNVMLALVHARGMPRAAARAKAVELLRTLGVEARGHALPRELSGGESQRVAIARALALDPPLLLLDEPTASLDPARRDDLGELLQGLADQGRALLLTTHDVPFVREWTDRLLILAAGQVVEAGPSAAVL
ncbi:MAG: amino acid ABC transporter ATP-binding protein, partial [Planctomycetes bacterium]|nr:amino acid ABC transporter ATP-binding protein [Planctomycetota bacterium]